MYTRRNIRWNVIFRFAWWPIITFVVWSAVVTWVHVFLNSTEIDCSIPIAPLGTIGVAVAFYVGFKNNQAYDRYWEARKIWGGIVNVSRSWANQVLSFVSAAHSQENVDPKLVTDIQRQMIYRHLAWINSLRFQLRRKTPFGFEPKGAARKYMQATDTAAMQKQLCELLGNEELKKVCPLGNSATQILRLQSEHLRQVVEIHQLTEDFRHMAMMELITEMFSLQGKCERIKNTPFPRQFAYFSNVFVGIFIALLPFGIVGEMASRGPALVWLTVPLSAIISWIFFTMETVGDSSEDPFQNFVNDVPMTSLCRTIEIDLRQMLGETDVPPPLEPVNDILM